MPHVRFNHLELTVAPGTLDDTYRKELQGFYGDVMGWMVSDVEILGGLQVLLRPDEGQFILVAESPKFLQSPGYDHLGLLCDDRASVDSVLEDCESFRADDDRLLIKRYDDLVAGATTVHAFYFKYLLPIWFDVQVLERTGAPA